MGVWFLSTSIGDYVGGRLASFYESWPLPVAVRRRGRVLHRARRGVGAVRQADEEADGRRELAGDLMSDLLQFLIRHGYVILFGVVFVEQAGLPVASVPVLLGIGALSADGRFSFSLALLVTLLACLPADTIWYRARPAARL